MQDRAEYEQKPTHRILGVDPGYARCGYAVLDYQQDKFRVIDYGIIQTEARTSFAQRLLRIACGIEHICTRYRPTHMAIEEIFFYKNRTTAISTAEARGVCIVAAARQNLAIFEYTPMQVKLAVTGYGRADKAQVQQMVKILLGLKEVPQPDDIADALAVAICHGHSGCRQDSGLLAGT